MKFMFLLVIQKNKVSYMEQQVELNIGAMLLIKLNLFNERSKIFD